MQRYGHTLSLHHHLLQDSEVEGRVSQHSPVSVVNIEYQHVVSGKTDI